MMKVKYNADTKQYILAAVRTGLVSPEEVQNAVNEYLKDNPVKAGSKLTVGIVELLADRWISKNENLHSQVVTIEGATPYSQVDLTPSVEQLVVFYEKDLTFVTENEEGVVTVYAIGQKPTNDYSIQATIKEVTV
jgi:hypothetical protein